MSKGGGGACECPRGGCFPIFRRADDVTRTMSKGGGVPVNVQEWGRFSNWRHADNVQGGVRLVFHPSKFRTPPPPPPHLAGWLWLSFLWLTEVLLGNAVRPRPEFNNHPAMTIAPLLHPWLLRHLQVTPTGDHYAPFHQESSTSPYSVFITVAEACGRIIEAVRPPVSTHGTTELLGLDLLGASIYLSLFYLRETRTGRRYARLFNGKVSRPTTATGSATSCIICALESREWLDWL